jgi:hypothetical protein
MEEENKNKRKVHITPEMLREFKEDYEKHAIMTEEEAKQEAERDAILFGDSYIMHMDRESCLKALLGPLYISTAEMEGFKPGQIAMLKAACVDEKAYCLDDLVEFGTVIHRDGVDKNLRGMTVAHMHVDDFHYNLPDPPETDIVTVIQSVDYDKLKKVLDVRRHTHYLFDSWGSGYLEELKEERNNDSLIGKIRYSGSASDCIRMLSARYNKANSAYRCRKRHRK